MSKKTIIILLLSAYLSAGCAANQNCSEFENYRFNPFQFPYPEYFMKAETIELKSRVPEMADGKTKINFYGLSAVISKKWFSRFEESSGFISYLSNKEKIFLINYEKDSLMGCISPETKNNQKDYCSAFSSTQEYFDKLFLLTRNDLKRDEYAAKGNSWIVHQKGFWFKDIKSIYKYKSKDFTAYRMDYKPDTADSKSSLKTNVFVFHRNLSPHAIGIGISSSVERYEELLAEILTSIE
jgi:hypothetical protein